MFNSRIYLVLLLLGGIFTSHGNVLCIGADGHIAIEPVGHDHCEGGCEKDGGNHYDNGVISGIDNCHHCTDSPLMFEAIKANRKNIKTQQPIICNIQQSAICSNAIATEKIGEESSYLYSFPPPLRTIVLLI